MADNSNHMATHVATAFGQAIASAEQAGSLMSAVGVQIFNQTFRPAFEQASKVAAETTESAADSAHSALSETTESVGQLLNPLAENPAVDYVARVPGLSWLTSALGRVNKEKAQADVNALKAKYPTESAEALAHRIIVDNTVKAGGIGLATNIIPPVALGLFAIDLAAVAALQSEMLYRIAASYDFDVADPARKGEALTIFALSLGASTAVKTGLGVVELIPLVGAAVGAGSNAGLLYGFGSAASQFYQRKREKLNRL